MILNVLSTLFLIFTVLFASSALIMGHNVKRTRQAHSKKVLIRRKRNTWVLALFTFAVSVTLFAVGFIPNYYRNQMNGDVTYEPAAAYKAALNASSKEKAYLFLPYRVERYGNTFAVVNNRDEWFVYDTVENSDGETTRRWVNRAKKAAQIETAEYDGQTALSVRLSVDGRLYLDGSFPYMQYDNNKKNYNSCIAKKVKSFSFSGNTLSYLTDNGDVYALGLNSYGQMGDSSNRNKISPTFIRSDITSLSVGATHSMMVDTFGNLYATGDNSDSELGDGTMNNSSSPIRVLSGVKTAAVGNFFSVILAQNGDVYTCGRTTLGQCGNGTKNGTAIPVKIAEGAVKVVSAATAAAYMTKDGKVYAWGANTDKMLVEDNVEFLNTPTLVAENAYDIAINGSTLAILTRDRNLVIAGGLRDKKQAHTQTILTMDAQVPDEFVNPFTETEKPDISELGK